MSLDNEFLILTVLSVKKECLSFNFARYLYSLKIFLLLEHIIAEDNYAAFKIKTFNFKKQHSTS